ncbi:2,3-bisphosphoglycerate-independent phosphoglycerate mutase [Lewinella sp. 4G2]|uniref:2,3-bisphosphoglycerate-independent phosphoglycerate mutase n=1 Tax=Lewinella sp. 4G2 TaxID=1803372 RepID=UPI0007B492AC|nr:2,3-bisphosphoglycerate-independent phosphoglycerate mutase [Lewinella sp. 4G2]OAV44142.1 phosphoglycerate mutase (2,3-diphosphoglycerate-independent) [Lewinella sp. 4G2]
MTNDKAFLIILDGWGIGARPEDDAIAQASTPVYDRIYRDCPHATLITYGEEVGLPEGQMGNSEVGHLNIGAGRVVYQSFARINKSIRDGELQHLKVLQDALTYARVNDKNVHFIGLLSDGGVHSHIKHLLRLTDIATEAGNEKIFIHAFMDGRDVSPTSGTGYLQQMNQHLAGKPTQLASVIGRFYAMDRDTRWERIRKAYDLMVQGIGTPSRDAVNSLQAWYDAGNTDEFADPIVMTNADGSPVATIEPGDVVINFNFRTDRPRQITRALTQEPFPDQAMVPIPNLRYVCLTQYDEKFTGVDVLFTPDDLNETIGEVVSKAGKTQVRIAETEKYAHVTFFFSGGQEDEFPGERRILIDSPRDVQTYDEKPEMGAYGIRDAIVQDLRENQPDFICLNFANTDMVGHTGNFAAAVKSAEVVDECLGDILRVTEELGYHVLVIADHGNSDEMRNPDGSVQTAHTTNPVPVIYVGPRADAKLAQNGKLGDVAPTLLELMRVEQPAAMSGSSLLKAQGS